MFAVNVAFCLCLRPSFQDMSILKLLSGFDVTNVIGDCIVISVDTILKCLLKIRYMSAEFISIFLAQLFPTFFMTKVN